MPGTLSAGNPIGAEKLTSSKGVRLQLTAFRQVQ